jgi:hypothetical protein
MSQTLTKAIRFVRFCVITFEYIYIYSERTQDKLKLNLSEKCSMLYLHYFLIIFVSFCCAFFLFFLIYIVYMSYIFIAVNYLIGP